MVERNPREEILEYVDKQVGSRPEAVGDFLEGLVESSLKTAEHLEVNWQDAASGNAWRNIAKAIERAERIYRKEHPF